MSCSGCQGCLLAVSQRRWQDRRERFAMQIMRDSITDKDPQHEGVGFQESTRGL